MFSCVETFTAISLNPYLLCNYYSSLMSSPLLLAAVVISLKFHGKIIIKIKMREKYCLEKRGGKNDEKPCLCRSIVWSTFLLKYSRVILRASEIKFNRRIVYSLQCLYCLKENVVGRNSNISLTLLLQHSSVSFVRLCRL